MNNILSKKNLPRYIRFQFIPYFILFLFACIIDKQFPLITLLSIIIIYLYIYFIHRLIHNIPVIINPHLSIHHNHDKNNNSISQLTIPFIIETILNIFFFLSLYIIKNIFNIYFIKDSILFYTGIVYVSTHMINYSMFHAGKNHNKHHNYTNCNFGPDVYDIIFNTTCDNKYENTNHILINIIIAFYITLIVFKLKLY
jgi:sterol desaturase/sphingolipid hydroxylase (fatty acid hydroxylase superfamily)